MLTLLFLNLIAGAPPAALQGNWFLADYVQDGAGPVEIVSGGTPDMAIQGDRLVLYGAPVGRVTSDETKDPREINLHYEVSLGGGDVDPMGKTEEGIYKCEGDTLTICTATFGDPRPVDYSAPKGSKRRLYTYKRQPQKPQ
jgi:uncharacterized protein (TIGR03067 family)